MISDKSGIRQAAPIPTDPGTYVLILELEQAAAIQVGALGRFDFQAGRFGYVGSAQGLGGLRARIRRHARPPGEKRTHWHIDYLLDGSQLREAWWEVGRGRGECRWAEILSRSGSRYPQGFGASDCRCAGHLIFLGPDPDLGRVREGLQRELGVRLIRLGF